MDAHLPLLERGSRPGPAGFPISDSNLAGPAAERTSSPPWIRTPAPTGCCSHLPALWPRQESDAHKPDAPAKDDPSLARQACDWLICRGNTDGVHRDAVSDASIW